MITIMQVELDIPAVTKKSMITIMVGDVYTVCPIRSCVMGDSIVIMDMMSANVVSV